MMRVCSIWIWANFSHYYMRVLIILLISTICLKNMTNNFDKQVSDNRKWTIFHGNNSFHENQIVSTLLRKPCLYFPFTADGVWKSAMNKYRLHYADDSATINFVCPQMEHSHINAVEYMLLEFKHHIRIGIDWKEAIKLAMKNTESNFIAVHINFFLMSRRIHSINNWNLCKFNTVIRFDRNNHIKGLIPFCVWVCRWCIMQRNL